MAVALPAVLEELGVERVQRGDRSRLLLRDRVASGPEHGLPAHVDAREPVEVGGDEFAVDVSPPVGDLALRPLLVLDLGSDGRLGDGVEAAVRLVSPDRRRRHEGERRGVPGRSGVREQRLGLRPGLPTGVSATGVSAIGGSATGGSASGGSASGAIAGRGHGRRLRVRHLVEHRLGRLGLRKHRRRHRRQALGRGPLHVRPGRRRSGCSRDLDASALRAAEGLRRDDRVAVPANPLGLLRSHRGTLYPKPPVVEILPLM